MCDTKWEKQESEEESTRERGIPPLHHSLSNIAYGQTHFSHSRHNTNDRDTTQMALGTNLKQGYLKFVA